jgi:hypothetical protein
MKFFSLTISALLVITVACREKEPTPSRGQEAGASKGKTPVKESVLLAADRGGVSQKLVRDEGGDQLPVVVDPESPGSCAQVARGERCGLCCADVFIDESERWYQCMNACSRTEHAGHDN